ncbi:hypothetical protein [Nonomuraea typhae]|uniref:hypothetical protein n=1 Tax=Nonomuraea typhae TaxID=2603600 RepID=UPI0012F7B864|nr:hypothetical protein [Nonomuraea typhae]
MTSTNTAKPHLVAAVNELGALACAVRPDWTVTEVTGALVDARTVGMTWAQTIVGMARLIVDLQARPGELVPTRTEPPRSARRTAVLESHASELQAARDACAAGTAKLKAAEQVSES